MPAAHWFAGPPLFLTGVLWMFPLDKQTSRHWDERDYPATILLLSDSGDFASILAVKGLFGN